LGYLSIIIFINSSTKNPTSPKILLLFLYLDYNHSLTYHNYFNIIIHLPTLSTKKRSTELEKKPVPKEKKNRSNTKFVKIQHSKGESEFKNLKPKGAKIKIRDAS
jgi:hypothetical protein